MKGVYTNLERALEEALSRKFIVEVGIRPSGIIHAGNLTTLAFAAVLAKQIPSGTLSVAVCDLDLYSTRGQVATPLQYMKKDNEGMSSKSKRLSSFVSALCKELDVDANIRYLSSLHQTSGHRRAIKYLVEKRSPAKRILHGTVGLPDTAPINPICSSCRTITHSYPTVDNDLVYANCKNEECSVESYRFRLDDMSVQIGLHYLLDPIRDRTVEPHTDIHVFGADYLEKHGKLSKISKVLALTQLVGGSCPEYFVAPVLLNSEGEKMSKSHNNGLTLDDLAGPSFDLDNVVGRMLDLVYDLGESKQKSVRYETIEMYFS